MANSPNVREATDGNFATDVLGSDQLALVDFWAPWCGPCRLLAPTIDSVADEFAGKVKVFKMNVDENPGTPDRYSVRGIPTVILFRNGQPVAQIMGNVPKDRFVSTISEHLG